MESKTATAIGAGIVTVITPLVFPAIPVALGAALYTIAGGLFIYAGRDQIPLLFRRRRSGNSGIPAAPDAQGAASAGISILDSEDGPTELTLSLAGRLIAQPISAKTLQVLRTIASREAPQFRLQEIVDAVPGATTYRDVSGVWAALTRRTRRMLNDPSAELIQWHPHYDADGKYVDWIGRVAPMTHASLRKQLGYSSSGA
jgi:hypothetical protein